MYALRHVPVARFSILLAAHPVVCSLDWQNFLSSQRSSNSESGTLSVQGLSSKTNLSRYIQHLHRDYFSPPYRRSPSSKVLFNNFNMGCVDANAETASSDASELQPASFIPLRQDTSIRGPRVRRGFLDLPGGM